MEIKAIVTDLDGVKWDCVERTDLEFDARTMLYADSTYWLKITPLTL